MNVKLKEKIRESLSAVLPITGIVLLLSSVLIPLEIGVMAMFFAGAFMLIIGMGMFQLGVEMSRTRWERVWVLPLQNPVNLGWPQWCRWPWEFL